MATLINPVVLSNSDLSEASDKLSSITVMFIGCLLCEINKNIIILV
jgi:hypothetical protein